MYARVLAIAGLALLAPAGCGGGERLEGTPDPSTERSDRRAKPPAGWRSFVNRPAGFSVSVPRDWAARRRGTATLIRSPDRLVAITVAADRTTSGRETAPRRYAREAFHALPGFRRLAARRTRQVAGSPYPSARVDGTGTLARRAQRQRITVAAFRRARRATFTVIAFASNARGIDPHTRKLDVLLRSLRGRRPLI